MLLVQFNMLEPNHIVIDFEGEFDLLDLPAIIKSIDIKPDTTYSLTAKYTCTSNHDTVDLISRITVANSKGMWKGWALAIISNIEENTVWIEFACSTSAQMTSAEVLTKKCRIPKKYILAINAQEINIAYNVLTAAMD